MNTRIPLVALAALSLSAAAFAETLTFVSDFKAEEVRLVPAGNGETLVDWTDGTLGSSAPGKPWIPTKTITFRLPDGFAYVSHEVEVGEAVLLAADVVPIPEQQPVPTGEEQTSATPRDAAAYASAEPYPALRGRFVSKGSMRGVPLVSFELAPIWYVAAEKKLYLASSITVKVKAEPQPVPTGPAAPSFPSSPLFESSVNSLVVNPETKAAPQKTVAAAKGGSGAEYLVITGPGLTDGAQMLADFRGEFNGVGTKVVTTDEIATSYSGSDLQEKIRACITWYVANKGTTMVVLAGDDTIIPTRRVKMIMTNDYSDTGPTDLYYSDLTGTYESSESGFIYQTDSLRGYSGLDLNPDVVVGRIPVRTGTQLCDYVRKVISYERTTTADSDIVRKTLIGGYTIGSTLTRVGDTGNDWRDSKQGSISFAVASETFQDGMTEYLDFKNGETMSDAEVRARRLNKIYRLAYNPYFRTSFFFGTTSSWDQDSRGDHVQGYDTFTAALSRGYHQAMVDAHGNYTLWGQGVTGNGPFFNADYAMLLSNRVDFVYTVACYTGGFDMAEPSLSEGFLRSRGGALGYIGCSRYGWDYNMCAYGTGSGSSDWCLTGILRGQSLQYAVEFQKRIYGLDKDGNTFERDTTLGAAFMNHKAAFASKWSDLYTLWLTFYINLQGDPLLTYHLPPRETGTAADSAESGLVTLLRDRPVAVSANSATVRLAVDEIVLGKTAAVSLEYSTSPRFSSSATTVPVGDFTQQAETEKTITGLSPATTYYVRAKSVIGETHMSPFSLSFTTLPANTVGGTVLDAGGTPVANVTVRAKDGSGTVVGTTQTGADGVYALTLSAGWTGTVEIVAPKGFAAGAAASVTIPSGGSATADFSLTKVVYVNGRASGKNDGSSWTDAFTTLYAALKVAAAGDQVWVAEGVYTPEEIAAYGRDCHFAPASGVFVYGGFAGNETSLSARDWIAHPTVLSGDIGTKGNASDNCLHLIRYAAGALFDGFGLTGANMDTFVNTSTSDSSYGAVVGSPESNPSAKVVGGVYPQFGENPGSTSGPIFFDHCAVTNNSATAQPFSGANLVGSGAKAVFRNSLIACNTVNNALKNDKIESYNGMMNNTLLDNCTVTANSTVFAPFTMARIRNTIVVGNAQSQSCGVKTSAESGSDNKTGAQRVIFMHVTNASSGSDKFMSESYYYDSTATGLNIPSDAWYPAATSADVGWTTKDGFAYALGEKSGAAEKGKVLEWMTEDTLDYLGNPRVHGTVPDLGCCEAVADAGGGEEEDDDDDDDEIIRPEDAPVKPESEIDAMTWSTLFPTAKTYADTAASFDLPYRQHSPTTADGVKYPLVIFLHGAGEIGTDNEKQVKTENDVIPITKYAMKHGDAFVLAPQCPGASGSDYSLTWSGANWNNCPMTRLETPTKPMAALVKLIAEFVADNPVDPTRIYVTGLSMGGFGTWDLASRMSDTFAAVMPCCGGADPNAAALYNDGMAIRFFHGSSDNVVSPNFSRGMDTALTTAGIEHDYIEYSGVNHVDCWRKAYVDTDLNLEWLFGHIKGEEYVAPDHGDTTENAPLSTIANGGWLGWKLAGDGSSVVNRGTKVWAYAQNYSCRQGRFGANLVVNEVEFTKSGGFASDDTGIKNHITCDKTFGYGRDNFGVEDLSDGTSDFARMIKTGWEATGDQGPVQTYTLHGLTYGKLYLVQFIYHCASTDRAMLSVIAPGGTVSTRVNGWDANGQNLDENWRYGGSLVGVFTASGSDQALVITYSKTSNYILNAVQLREVTAAELTDGPAIEYGTPTIGSVTPSVNGTTATLTLANVAAGENGGCYQVWLAYAEDGTTLGSETAALISQQSASCAVEIKNLTAGKKYNYSLYVKNEGNVISAKKTGSFTMPGGGDPDPVEPPSGDDSGDWTAIPMTSDGGVFSTDGDLVFAFSRDRGDPGTTYENSSTPVTFNYINSLTDTVTKYHQWQHGGAKINGPYDNGLQPADYIAASPVLNGARGDCGDEGLGSDMSGFGSMLGCMWTGSSSDLKDTDNKATFTFKRLTSGHKYLVEFFIHDHEQAKSITSPDGEATIYYGGTGWQYGGVLRGTFVATAETQDIVLTYSDPGSYGMGAIQLRDLGEAPEDPDDPQDETIASAAAKLGLGRWLAMPLTGDPADIVTNGTMVVINKKNLSGAKSYGTVNGVSFGGSWSGDGGMTSTPNVSNGKNNCTDCNVSDTAYNNILKNAFTGKSAVEHQVFTFAGLTPDATYLVQYICHGQSEYPRSATVTDARGAHSIEVSAATSSDKWYYGGTLIHVFKADANGAYELTIEFRDSKGAVDALVNAFQVREIEAREEPDDPVDPPAPPPVYTLTIPTKAGLVIGSVSTNGTAVAGTEGTYSIVSNTEVTITFTAASGYELDGNDGVVVKTITANTTFTDADYPAVKEQGGEDPDDPPAGEDVWIAIPMTSNGSVFSTDGDLVFAFSRDRGDPGTTYENSSTPVTFNYINSLTDTVTKYHPWQHGGAAIDGPYGNGLQPADYIAASPVLNGARGDCGDEGLGSDMSGFGSMLGCMWTGPSLSGTDNKATFTFKRLTSGHKYLVEFFIHDHDQVKSITSPDGEATIYYGGTGWQYGGVLRGTFTAVAATQDIVLTYSDPGSYGMGAIQLRDLGVAPEDPDDPGSITEAAAKLAPGEWLAAQLTGSAADVLTAGTLVAACAPYEIVGDASVNNVSFGTDKGDPSAQFVGALTVGISIKPGEGTYKSSGADSASGYGKILGNGWYANNGTKTKFTYSNLTAGETYLVQLFVHDGRTNNNPPLYSRTAAAPNDSTKYVQYGAASAADDWYYGGTLIHVFTATDATYEFYVDYPSNAPQINAIQLRQLGDVPDEPEIELVVPEFAADGSALGFTGAAGTAGAKFSMTISNPVKDAWYTVFTAEKLTDTFKAAKDSERFDGGDTTMTLTVDADKPSLFAKIVISTAPYKSGSEL